MMMVVVRLSIDAAAFAAFDERAMRVMMRDIDEKLCLAAAAAIGFIAAAFTQRLARRVVFNLGAPDGFGVNDKHVKLRHGSLPAW